MRTMYLRHETTRERERGVGLGSTGTCRGAVSDRGRVEQHVVPGAWSDWATGAHPTGRTGDQRGLGRGCGRGRGRIKDLRRASVDWVEW